MNHLYLCTVLGVAVTVGCASGWSEADQRRDDWIAERYDIALDALLPLECDAVLSCRAHRDFWVEQHEYMLSLHDGAEGGAFLRVRTPVRQSLWIQLSRLYRSDRSASLPDLISQLKVQVEDLSLDSCPELATAISSRDETTFSPTQPGNVITIHPWVRTCCEHAENPFVVTIDEHPLAAWLSQVQAAIPTCQTAANQTTSADATRRFAPGGAAEWHGRWAAQIR